MSFPLLNPTFHAMEQQTIDILLLNGMQDSSDFCDSFIFSLFPLDYR